MEQQNCSRFHQTVHLKHSEEELEDGQAALRFLYLSERKVESAFPGQTRLYKQTEEWWGLSRIIVKFDFSFSLKCKIEANKRPRGQWRYFYRREKFMS